MAHLLQVSLHVDEHPLHRRTDGAKEPRRDERRRSPGRRRLRLLRRRTRRPLPRWGLYLRRGHPAWGRRNGYQLRLRPLVHFYFSFFNAFCVNVRESCSAALIYTRGIREALSVSLCVCVRKMALFSFCFQCCVGRSVMIRRSVGPLSEGVRDSQLLRLNVK